MRQGEWCEVGSRCLVSGKMQRKEQGVIVPYILTGNGDEEVSI